MLIVCITTPAMPRRTSGFRRGAERRPAPSDPPPATCARPRRESRVRAMSCVTLAFERFAAQVVVPPPVALLDEPERRIQERGEIRSSRGSRPASRHLVSQLAPRVPALVAEKAIVVVECPRSGRNDQRGRPARLQHACDLAQGSADRRAHAREGSRSRRRRGSNPRSAVRTRRPAAGERRARRRGPSAAQRRSCRRRSGPRRDARPGDPRAGTRSSSRDRRRSPPASSGSMPSIIARRVHRSRKWVRDASAWTASSSSDQLTEASVST